MDKRDIIRKALKLKRFEQLKAEIDAMPTDEKQEAEAELQKIDAIEAKWLSVRK